MHQIDEFVLVSTLLDEFAACRKFDVLELVIVSFVALCELVFATSGSPDDLKSIIKVDHGLCNLFELVETPGFLFR